MSYKNKMKIVVEDFGLETCNDGGSLMVILPNVGYGLGATIIEIANYRHLNRDAPNWFTTVGGPSYYGAVDTDLIFDDEDFDTAVRMVKNLTCWGLLEEAQDIHDNIEFLWFEEDLYPQLYEDVLARTGKVLDVHEMLDAMDAAYVHYENDGETVYMDAYDVDRLVASLTNTDNNN